MDVFRLKVRASLDLFKALLSSNHLKEYEKEVSRQAWKDQYHRLIHWSVKTGSQDRNQDSIDFRLRESADLVSCFLEQLDALEQNLSRAISQPPDPGFVSKPDEICDDPNDEDHEGESVFYAYGASSWMEQHHKGVGAYLDILEMLASTIKHPHGADYTVCFSKRNRQVLRFQNVDRQHVIAKFPSAPEALIARVSLTISRCRAILKYREKRYKEPGDPTTFDWNRWCDDEPEEQSKSTEIDNHPQQHAHGQTISSSGHLEMVYNEDLVHGRQALSMPPPPPESALWRPFQCPYCFYTIVIEDGEEESWREHVFSDMLPYVCVFSDCVHNSFKSRDHWFGHIRRDHMSDIKTGLCPLCQKHYDFPRLKDHIASHLEELALFALVDPFSRPADQEIENKQVSDRAASASAPQEQENQSSPTTASESVSVSSHPESSSEGLNVDSEPNISFSTQPEQEISVAKFQGSGSRRVPSIKLDILHICCKCNQRFNIDSRRCSAPKCPHVKCTRCRFETYNKGGRHVALVHGSR